MVRNDCSQCRTVPDTFPFYSISRAKLNREAMATVFGIDHRYFAVGSIAASLGVAIYATYRLTRASGSTSPSEYYETQKQVNEYLVFHYGKPKEVLAYEDFGPTDSLDFPKRCAELCLKHYKPKVSILQLRPFSRVGFVVCYNNKLGL